MPVYLPTLVTSIVQSGTVILLPLYMLDRGYGISDASLIVAMRGLGLLLTDVPAGLFANRFGDKYSMLAGCCALLIAMVLLSVSEHQGLIMLAALLTGSSVALTLLGRMSYVTDSVKNEERGRMLALMAGIQRGGALLGPLLFGALAKYFSYQAAFGVMTGLILFALFSIAVYAIHHEASHRQQIPLSAMFGVIVKYSDILLTVGLGGLCLMMVRSARVLLLPIFGHGFGLDEVQIGLLFSLSSIIDILMFYPAGQIMDDRGRKWTAVPGTLLLSLSLLVLTMIPSVTGMLLFAVLSGLGNGITTGVLVTIGSDVAPDVERGQFLGVWRLQLDIGHTAAPLIIGYLSEIVSLSIATLSIFCCGLAGAVIFSFLMKETLVKKSRS